IGSGVEHARKVVEHVDTEVRGNQCIDVATVAGGAICPQSSLLAIEHHLEAVAGTTQHVADQELATALLARREQGDQNGFKTREQFGTQFFAFGIAEGAAGGVGLWRDVVEVESHSASSPSASPVRPCAAVLRAAHADSSDGR